VLPVIAEIKHVGELLAEAEPAQGHPLIVEQVVRVPVLTAGDAQAIAVGARELVQMADGQSSSPWPAIRSTRIDSQVLAMFWADYRRRLGLVRCGLPSSHEGQHGAEQTR